MAFARNRILQWIMQWVETLFTVFYYVFLLPCIFLFGVLGASAFIPSESISLHTSLVAFFIGCVVLGAVGDYISNTTNSHATTRR